MLIQLLQQYPAKKPALVPALIVLAVMIPVMSRHLWRGWAREENMWGEFFGCTITILLFVLLAVAAWKDR